MMSLTMNIHFNSDPFVNISDAIEELDDDVNELINSMLLEVPEITNKTVSKDDELYRFNDT